MSLLFVLLSELSVALCLMAVCVAIHAGGLMAALRWTHPRIALMDGRFWPVTRMLIGVAGWSILLHLCQIAIWGSFYAWKHGTQDLRSALYFSVVTYTTTGYGDLVLPPELRLVGGIEALTGILMCGLSTGFFFATAQKVQSHGLPGARLDDREAHAHAGRPALADGIEHAVAPSRHREPDARSGTTH